jgi:hypothetical protein
MAEGTPRLVGGVHSRTQGYRGEPSRGLYLSVNRGLKSDKLDTVPLTRRDLLILMRTAAAALERELESIPAEHADAD